jgi:hypothetical protein
MLNAYPITEAILEPVTLALAKQQCRIDASFSDDDQLLLVYIGAARRLAEKKVQGSFFNRTWRRTIDNFPLAANYDTTISPADRAGWPFAAQIWNRIVIDLPGGRTRKINSLSYLDGNGNLFTVDPSVYRADLASIPARLTPAKNSLCWPWQGQYLPGSVEILYEVANYTAAIIGEAFTVPVAGTGGTSNYQLSKTWATGLERLVNGSGAAVAGALLQTDPVTGTSSLVLPGALAGQALTVDYDVKNMPDDITNALLMLIAHWYRNPEATTDLTLKTVPMAVDCLLEGHAITWGDYRPC